MRLQFTLFVCLKKESFPCLDFHSSHCSCTRNFLLTWSLAVRADDALPAAKPPAPSQAAGQGAVVADFDSDGRLDLLVTGAVAQPGVPAQPQQLSEDWIGIDGTSPDDALRVQLELPAGQGLLINQVVENSPAAKAGLKQYDVLLTCHDAPIVQISNT